MVVTHDPEVGEVAQRTVVLEYGKITKEIHNDSFGQLFPNRGTRKERFIMKKKLIAMICILTLALLTLAGCSGSASYTDGTYEGKSELFEDNEDGDGEGYGVVSLTISGGVITDCSFSTFQLNGEPKDTEYGKEGGVIANQDYYNKAQRAVQACDQYAQQLVETGSLKDVDAVSGATINYNQFQDAVTDALNQAKG